jgi:hypothetical protein
MRAVPEVGAMNPASMRIVVDLPAPLGPRKPTTSPCITWKLTPSTAVKLPKRFVSPSISMNAVTCSLPASAFSRGGAACLSCLEVGGRRRPCEEAQEEAGGAAALAGEARIAFQQGLRVAVGDLHQGALAEGGRRFVLAAQAEAELRLAGLAGAERLAAAAQAEVLLGDDEAVLGVAQDEQALLLALGQVFGMDQQAARRLGAAPDAAAQLMQGGQAEALGLLDRG